MINLDIPFVRFYVCVVMRQGFYYVYVKMQYNNTIVSHKSNPLSVLRGIVDSYSTLPWVTWEVVTVVEGIP